jgi:hypothetical protein
MEDSSLFYNWIGAIPGLITAEIYERDCLLHLYPPGTFLHGHVHLQHGEAEICRRYTLYLRVYLYYTVQ